MVAATPRVFHFSHLSAPVLLQAGDALVFDGTLCHYGAGLEDGMPDAIALHMYAGVGIDDEIRSFTFEC